MEEIHIIARFKIHEGKLSELKNVAEKCVLATKSEVGALLYDWFVDDGKLECTVVETYQDSEAVLAHSGNVNEPLSKLLEIADFSGEVFGNASDELQKTLQGKNIVSIPFFSGL